MRPSSREANSAEHWLTLMTCAVCRKTPDHSPIYKCSLGHSVCYDCFRRLAQNEIPACTVCDSNCFSRQDVSADFLRKLKTRPGIGRPCRYDMHKQQQQFRRTPIHEFPDEEEMTVEKLFQMPPQFLNIGSFSPTEKNTNSNNINNNKMAPGPSDYGVKKNLAKTSKEFSTFRLNEWIAHQHQEPSCKSYTAFKDTASCMGYENTSSRKPLICPHDPCGKIIAVSSFLSHFKHEHFNMKRYQMERGTELSLSFDPGTVMMGKSVCLGIVRVFERFALPPSDGRQGENATIIKGGEEVEDTFWIMQSASVDDRVSLMEATPTSTYVLFWLFANTNENAYKCTLELSASGEAMVVTTFCNVNGMAESQRPLAEIFRAANCLYVTEGTLRGMLTYGADLKLKIIVH